jgi:putative transposase
VRSAKSCADLTCCFTLGAPVYSSRLLVYGPDVRLAGVLGRSDEDKDRHRSHQGLQQEPAWQPGRAVDITARIERRQVLGGLISEYRKAA